MATIKTALQLLQINDEKERDRMIAKLSPKDAKFVLKCILAIQSKDACNKNIPL